MDNWKLCFINAVKSYPCLWNPEVEDYKTIHVKEAAWKSVAKQCDISDVREAKHIWKKLRDGYRQTLRNKKFQSHTSWKYKAHMAFILPHLKLRTSSTNEFVFENIDSTLQSASESEIESESFDIMTSELPIDEKNSELFEPVTKKRKKSKEHKIKYFNTESEDTSTQRDILEEEIYITGLDNSTVNVFFDSMCQMCKSLPEYLQIKIQRSVFNAVMDARKENLKSSKP